MNIRRRLKIIGLGLLLSLPWIGASAQQVNLYCWVDAGPPVHWGPCNSTNPLYITGTITITPSGTQNVNLTQILSAAPSLTNPLWVFPATGATFPVSGTVTANQGTANATPWPVSLTSTTLTGNVSVIGPTADGSPAANPPVLIGGTVDGSASGNVGVAKVDAAGLAYNAITNWGGGALGAMANYGTSPGAVLTPGVNAFITNTVTVTGTVGTTEPVGITPTDRTVTSATGSSQTMMSANASRHSLTIENTGNANCGINPTGGTAAIGGAGTITLTPLGSYSPRVPTLSAVTVICTSGQPLYGDEN